MVKTFADRVYPWSDMTRLPPSRDATPDQALVIERFTLLSFAIG